MKIVLINGVPRSGKDLFVTKCQSIIGARCFNVSTVDFVKEVAKYAGWDGSKTPENRAFLSNLKDLLTDWNDVPFKDVEAKLKQFEQEASLRWDSDQLIAFVHCREPKELAKFKERLGAITLLIRRPAVEQECQSNHADSEVFNYQYDYEISNAGTFDELRDKAAHFLNTIGLIGD